MTRRTRSPDLRAESDRPGCRLCLRLDEAATADLDRWRGKLGRTEAVRLALKEKALRFSRQK